MGFCNFVTEQRRRRAGHSHFSDHETTRVTLRFQSVSPALTMHGMRSFVSRAGLKLDHALTEFAINVEGLVCADLGSNVGGFVDCLLQRGGKVCLRC